MMTSISSKKWVLCLFIASLCWNPFVGAATDHCIVYVHIGDRIPQYAHEAIDQAALFNPDTPIYFLANQRALQHFNNPHLIKISLESLPPSVEHKLFLKNSRKRLGGLFLYSVERFFFLEEFASKHGVKHIFHMEYDNMLYQSLASLLPHFELLYPEAAATLDNDDRGIAGFIYFSSSKPLKDFTHFILSFNPSMDIDMVLLGKYNKATDSRNLDFLPIIPRAYTEDYPLISLEGHKGENPENYCKNVEAIDGIFDAAAIGQYLGGIDPIHQKGDTSGFINESCVFDPSKLTYVWEVDDHGRKVPYAVYRDEKRRIINLHVHCKNLKPFASKE